MYDSLLDWFSATLTNGIMLNISHNACHLLRIDIPGQYAGDERLTRGGDWKLCNLAGRSYRVGPSFNHSLHIMRYFQELDAVLDIALVFPDALGQRPNTLDRLASIATPENLAGAMSRASARTLWPKGVCAQPDQLATDL